MNSYLPPGPVADDYDLPPRTGLEPNGDVVVESYRKDIANGFEKGAPLYNPVGGRTGSDKRRKRQNH